MLFLKKFNKQKILTAVLFTALFSLIPLQLSAELLILSADIKEAITPATEKHIDRVLKTAENRKADAVLFYLDTPGGLLESTRHIVQSFLNAGITTIVYVSPSGARAGSAGVFITMAAEKAVMAPGCNIGAAHPVTMNSSPGGKDNGNNENTKNLSQKIENDTIAFIKSIADTRGRNSEWGIAAVSNSVSITSEEALELNVIDFIAVNKYELLKTIFPEAEGQFNISHIEKSWAEKLLSLLANPNLAYFLLMLGFYGIVYEIIHPGTIFSGAIGAFFLITALFAMQTLPVNYAGLLLIILSFVLFILEVFITSYGLLSIGAIISLITGSAMLFESPSHLFRLSMTLIIPFVFVTSAFFLLVAGMIIKSLKAHVITGAEGLSIQECHAAADFVNGRGKVFVHGERWNAESADEIHKDDLLIIDQVDNLKLYVSKKK